MEQYFDLLKTLLFFLGGIIILLRPSLRKNWWLAVAFLFYSVLRPLAYLAPEFYVNNFLLIRYTTYLFYLLAAAQAYRQLAGRSPRYPALATMIVILTAFLTSGQGLFYYPARIAVFGWVALLFGLALRKKMETLLFLSVSSVAFLVSDLLKGIVVDTDRIYQIIQMRIDPVLTYSILFYFVISMFLPLFKDTLRKIVVKTPPEQEMTNQKPDNMIAFPVTHPAALPVVPENGVAGNQEIDQLFAELLRNARVARREVFTREDLAVYLGISEVDAERFIRDKSIRKLQVQNSSGGWVVKKSAVITALESDQ